MLPVRPDATTALARRLVIPHPLGVGEQVLSDPHRVRNGRLPSASRSSGERGRRTD
jgi:hypothetical protein